jgi:uncharacterized protein with ParB-like and HNH nuclease domain
MAHTLIPPKSVVDGKPCNLQVLFSSDYLIPNYQRDYVWKTKTIEQLVLDLIEHYEKNTIDNQFKDDVYGYFLGAMVVITRDDEISEVVDGQQRLTTLSLISSVLHDLVKKNIPNSNLGKQGLLTKLANLTTSYDGRGVPESKIKFQSNEFNVYFLEIVAKLLPLKEKKNFYNSSDNKPKLKNKNTPFSIIGYGIGAIYKNLHQFIRSTPSKDARITRLLTFTQLFLECIIILKIEAKSYDSAYHIFESLNNRGIPLSQADLIKNELLKKANPSDRDDLIDNWNYAKSIIEGVDLKLTDFIHYSWLSRNGYVKAKDLLAKVEQNILSGFQTKEYSKNLKDDAEIFKLLFIDHSSSWPNDLKDNLNDINKVFGIKLSFPLAFSIYRKHKNDVGLLVRHFQLLTNFIFRFMKVGDGSVDALAEIMARCSMVINGGGDLSRLAAELQAYSSDEKFEDDFKDFSVNIAKLGYYTVFYLEKEKLNGTVPCIHGEHQHLEHIMPKKPTETGWPKAYSFKNEFPDDYTDLIWKIGNLMPLPATVNKSISNKSFTEKMQGNVGGYLSTSLITPHELPKYLDGGEWTNQSIVDRQIDLAKLAKKVWTLSV